MKQNTVDTGLLKPFIKRLPLFKSLSEGNITRILSGFSLLNVKKGETVFYQTDESTDLYIIISGAVKASLINDEGQELVLACFKEGDFLGEMSLLDGRPRSATVIAEDDSTLSVLKREKFLNTLKKEPMIAIEMLSALVGRLRGADEMIESLAFLDVSERLIKILHRLAKEEGEELEDGVYRIKKITHKELASKTCASREAVTKVLKVLTFKKVIRDEKGHFYLNVKAGGRV